jgi:TetR/AcrR family transcriptional regulator
MNTQSRKEQEKIARKNEIMEAGLQLFAEKDYHEVTVDEIAERVGLSKGTLYLYFKNKEDLFFSIVQGKADLFYERLHTATVCDKSFAECLHGFVYTFLSFFEEYKPYFKIIQSDKTRLSMDEHYRLQNFSMGVFHKFFDLMIKLIEIGKKQHVIRSIETVVLAKNLRGILNAFTFHRVFLGSQETVEQETDHVVDLFLHGAIKHGQ